MKKPLIFVVILLFIVIIILPVLECRSDASSETNECFKKSEQGINNCTVKIIREIDHKGDRIFTQGFEIYKGYLYEGTGRYDETSLKKIDLDNGELIKQQNIEEYLSSRIFGEGITIWKNEIIQLSWTSGKAFVYDLEFGKKDKVFRYNTQGWGLTHNSKHLIMSDGSTNLYFRDPETFKIVKTLNTGIRNLNELEYVDGVIFANIWMTNYIIAIDEDTGDVISKIDASSLLCCQLSHTDNDAVLNGIAYDKRSETFYVTGKNCPLIYEVKFVSK